MYYDRQGKPIDRDAACLLFEDPEARRIAVDEVGSTTLSTVHVVIDHSHGRTPPLIFETLVMGGSRDGEMWRYATEAQARSGHAAVLRELMLAEGVTLEEIELELAGR